VPGLTERYAPVLRRYKTRIEDDCARRGIQYPWWIPTYSSVGTICVAIAALAQRSGFGSPVLLLGGLLAVTPQVWWLAGARLFPLLVEAALSLAGTLVLIVDHPVEPDFAPFLLVISAAEAAATTGVGIALSVAVVDMVALGVLGVEGRLSGAALYVVGVALGADAGIAMRWQMRALQAERAKRDSAAREAVAGERARLAREVHDIVGHSLSISLLHIAGARRSLAEHDLADVDEALQHAEQVARAAMVDLRGSVSRIAAGGSGVRPLPDANEIARLVVEAREAGLRVGYEECGDPGDLPPGVGLCLYRIAQESLANIAKHAPSADAEVELRRSDGAVSLLVRNTLPSGAPVQCTPGAGLPGMATRAEQLGARFFAGPADGHWVVEAVVGDG
jgi:signal transduction histidine kinase